MFIFTLLLALTLGNPIRNGLPNSNLYPSVSIEKLSKKDGWVRPRALIVGKVTYVNHEADGDWHIKVTNLAGSFVVCEIIPELPINNFIVPTKRNMPNIGDTITIWGIVRWDGEHKWSELHPVIGWTLISKMKHKRKLIEPK